MEEHKPLLCKIFLTVRFNNWSLLILENNKHIAFVMIKNLKSSPKLAQNVMPISGGILQDFAVSQLASFLIWSLLISILQNNKHIAVVMGKNLKTSLTLG